jgi:putative membrane protein
MLIKFVLSALAVYIAAYLVPGIRIDSFITALVFALVIGVLNIFIKPLLLLLTLPLNILSLGLFTFVINLIILYLASFLVPGFAISSIFSAILFGLVQSAISSLLTSINKNK